MIEVVLVELKIPENIGFIARVMKNFGFEKLVLYNCNVSKESYITAAHAKDVLDKAVKVENLKEYLEEKNLVVGTTGVRSRRVERYIRRPYYTPEELREMIKGETAILFGREDYGLYDEELKLCNVIVSVPTSEEYPVMNVSHAAAVILYELSKGKFEFEKEEIATQKDVDRLVEYFEKLMKSIWFPEHRIGRMKVVLKRAFGRAALTKYEVDAISGIIRKTLLYLEELKK
ncbi:RNA methyltransferase, TrmH family, group 1 [Ferroglobus placidus DSM 10642]|uniref:RNA methyltransferase, TrmH family, group 1 n=1 Tax=Ferroglobus placidus (strain DSM 10642 / AEDII12DO) TaxID=589924 RepID=D3RWW9_FERPA|nr:RNA methyltransferase [Ferroglobus placidus]ADC64982.1 RNA methyltransferase, TrmH family, group 1 [Ferroglobus placidus DSM 10642]